MQNELDIVRDVSRKFEASGIPYMLTGSVAMSYYATPRMTRDIDVVVVVRKDDIDSLVKTFSDQYYISRAEIERAVGFESIFNLIHTESVIKVDCIVRKSSDYRQLEFGRRQRISIGDFSTYIVSMEDLILSKLLWARGSHSEMQLSDARNLLRGEYDREYLHSWAAKLGVDNLLDEVSDE